jgi:DNA repair protein SbcC/Rad50
MMRLRNLELNNFRGFRNDNTRIDLDHDAVLLYGRNGVGKTALFDAIELALTGTLRRVDSVADISSVLVNVRHDSEPATIRLEIGKATANAERKSTIRLGRVVEVEPLLGHEEISIFQHTAYLQQSDIRRLISADCTTLGEVIRSLAVSGEIERLDRALGEANLSRLNPAYKAVSKAFEEKRATIEQLKREIEADERTIKDIEGVEATINKATDMLHGIEATLGLVPSGAHTNAEDVVKAISTVDGVLQSRLTAAISGRAQAESRLNRAVELSRERQAIENAQTQAGASDPKDHIEMELKEVEEQIQDYTAELAKPEYAAISKQQQSKIIALLEAARSFSGAGACPICDQPHPDLMSHIEAKLKNLHQAQSRSQAAFSDLQRKLNLAEERRNRLSSAVDKSMQASRELAARLLSFKKSSTEFFSGYNDSQISLANAVYLETSAREAANQEIAKLSSSATQLSGLRSEISSALIRSSRIKDALELSRKKLGKAISAIKSAEHSKQALEDYLNTASEVRKRTSEGIEKILSAFALGPTKDNFEDLFTRLARAPLFKVTISQARVLRRKPEVHWCATYGEKQYKGDAIFSQGELNSCAMAFFLSLATTNPQSLGFLLLDDPVQNMDEIHIEEFGNILKFIKDQLGWQLIIGLHDESIYQYLKRQLYPSKGQQSLAAYTLEMGASGTELSEDVVNRFDPRAFLSEEVA